MEGVSLKRHLSTEENTELNSQTCNTQRQSWIRCRRLLPQHLSTAALTMRKHSCLISMESGSHRVYLPHVRAWCYFCIYPLQIYTNYDALQCGANSQLSPQSYQNLVPMNEHISALVVYWQRGLRPFHVTDIIGTLFVP